MTRASAFCALVAVVALSAGCAGSVFGPDDDLDFVDAPATVRLLGETDYVIYPDDEPGARYAADDVPESFQVDGLRVAFSGRRLPIPPNVRLIASPLDLTHIERLR